MNKSLQRSQLLHSSLLNNKKGASDLGTGVKIAIAFFGGIVTLVILGFILIIVSGNLLDAADLALPTQTASITNETLTTVTETGEYITAYTNYNCVLTSSTVLVTNATEGTLISTGNYTITGCQILFSGGADTTFNNTNWNVSGTYTYLVSDASNMLNNVTIATADFFSNATTWFTLLSIVIIIATVIIVLVMTRKARGKSGGQEL